MAFRKRSQETTKRRVGMVNQAVPTYSYHNKRNESSIENNSRDVNRTIKKQTKTAKKIWLEKFGFIVLAITVGVCLISILYLSSQSQIIMEPTVSGPTFANYKQSVENSANKLISSSILNRNKITFDSQKVTTTLEDEYPMFSNISITLPLIDHHPIVYLTPATPALIVNSNGVQYLVNPNGQIILYSLSSTGLNSMNLPQIDYTGGTIAVGKRVLTSDEVQFIQTVVYELGQKNLHISHMSLPQGTSELDVYITGLNYFVKFNIQNNDAKQQAGSFLAAKHYIEGQGTSPAQYIDVRTDGRVYYQ